MLANIFNYTYQVLGDSSRCGKHCLGRWRGRAARRRRARTTILSHFGMLLVVFVSAAKNISRISPSQSMSLLNNSKQQFLQHQMVKFFSEIRHIKQVIRLYSYSIGSIQHAGEARKRLNIYRNIYY